MHVAKKPEGFGDDSFLTQRPCVMLAVGVLMNAGSCSLGEKSLTPVG